MYKDFLNGEWLIDHVFDISCNTKIPLKNISLIKYIYLLPYGCVYQSLKPLGRKGKAPTASRLSCSSVMGEQSGQRRSSKSWYKVFMNLWAHCLYTLLLFVNFSWL